jgi:hypothetical protein
MQMFYIQRFVEWVILQYIQDECKSMKQESKESEMAENVDFWVKQMAEL